MNRPLLCNVLLVTALAFGCARGSEVRTQPAREEVTMRRELKPRWKIPLAAREMLTRRMGRHGDRMILVMESVVLLNYELAQELAQELADEPKLGRPPAGEKDTLNALLPAAFFTYQDELAERARELAAAARARDDDALTDALLGVTKTCVGCHAAYLYEGELEDAPTASEPTPTELQNDRVRSDEPD